MKGEFLFFKELSNPGFRSINQSLSLCKERNRGKLRSQIKKMGRKCDSEQSWFANLWTVSLSWSEIIDGTIIESTGAWVVGSRTGWTDEKLIAWHQLPWNITEKVLDTQLDWNQLKSFEDWTFIIKHTICRSTVHKACIRFNTRDSNFFILLC